MPVLKFGDVGDDVRQVQNDINQHYDEPGFKSAFRAELLKANLTAASMKKLDPDGKFGPLTRAAVRAFQIYRGLTNIDGIAGPETLSALYPYAVYRIQANVNRAATPDAGSQRVGDAPAKDSGQTIPLRVERNNQLRLQKFVDFSSQLPAPLLPPLPSPASPNVKKQSAVFQLKGGFTHNVPLLGSSSTPFDTLNLDMVGVIMTTAGIAHGLDFGWGLPLSDGASGSANLSWAMSYWPRLFRWKQFDLLGVSAKAGVGLGAKSGKPLQPSLSESLGVSARWRIIENDTRELDLVLTGTLGEKETLSIGPTSITASTTFTGFVGFQVSAF
jgi:peptidoglycan hydrolase-like protein with peptidoglycan-binding domain